ncbi:MAG: hypothetical protein Q9195_008158 [Heterodermia aff. obscurata]
MSIVLSAHILDPTPVSSIAKKTLFPLHSCMAFEKREEAWIEPLAFDPAYLNAMIFTTLDYFDSMQNRSRDDVSQRTLPHYLRTVRLLRERLMREDNQSLATHTVATILALAAHAHFVGDTKSAKHHLEGLRKIVSMRGGVATFTGNAKLLGEILRCDIGVALESGSKPLFFNRSSSSEPLLPYPVLTLFLESITPDTRYDSELFLCHIDTDLAEAWKVSKKFCLLINCASECNHRIATETFLETMASVVYRLLDLAHFQSGATDETIRLGLLVFSSSVFLQWQQLGKAYDHLAAMYRDSLAKLRYSHLPPQLLLWLLLVGAVSILGEADHIWLKPWLRVTIALCKVESWTETQDLLNSFIWIGLVLDKPAKEVYHSTFVYYPITPLLTLDPT